MKQNPLPQSLLSNLISSQDSLIICSNCNIKIPFISIWRKDNTILVEMKCDACDQIYSMEIEKYIQLIKSKPSIIHYCTKEDDHTTLTSNHYCLNCSKWLCNKCLDEHASDPDYCNHFFSLRGLLIDMECPKHVHSKFASFCKDCSLPVCKNCLEESYINHVTVSFESILNEINNIDLKGHLGEFQKIREKNKRNKDYLVEMINSEIKQLKKYLEDIQSAYAANEKKNKMIEELLVIAYNNAQLLKNLPSFELYINIKSNSIVNNEQPDFNVPTLKEKYVNLINYYKTNFIIQVKNEMVCRSTIKCHDDMIACLIQLKDERLVTGSKDRLIKVWSCNQFTCEHTLPEQKSSIYALIQLNNGHLVSGSLQTMKWWNISLWTCIATVNVHLNTVNSFLQLKDNRLVSASKDSTIKLWNPSSFKCVHTMKEHTKGVYTLLELRDGRIASGSRDTSIKLWNVDELKCTATLQKHTNWVVSLCQLKDGKLLSGSKDECIILWDLALLSQVGIFKGSWDIIFSLLQLSDGTLLSGSGQDIIMWDRNSMQSIRTLTEHDNYICSLIEMKDGRIASASYDKTLKIWEI